MADGHFLTTRWSMVLRAGSAEAPGARSEDAREALERLAESYWIPLFAYVRRRGYAEDDARDLTQAFFARLLERQDVGKASPERGRFRSFLLTSLKNFLINEKERERTLKRGGGTAPLSFDARDADGLLGPDPVDDETPERIFERTWARSVLERALQRLREDYDDRGKLELFAFPGSAAKHSINAHDDVVTAMDARGEATSRSAGVEALSPQLVGGESTPYAELAESLGYTEGAIKVAVHRLRGRYKKHLRQEVADTVADPSDIDDELRGLFEALAGP